MKIVPSLLAILLVTSIASLASAQEPRPDAPAARLTRPIDFWGKGPSEKSTSTAAVAAEIGPGRILLWETVWAQPIRTPDGNWMLYVPPKPILDFLENPTEESAKAYLAWKKEQAEKLGRAMLLLGRLKEGAAAPKVEGASGKPDQARKDESGGASLIYFKKPSCPHCISQDAVLTQWLPKHSGIRSQVVLPGEEPELWKSYAVRGTPTLVLRAENGKEEVLVGLQSEAQLDAALKRSTLPSPSETQTKEGSR